MLSTPFLMIWTVRTSTTHTSIFLDIFLWPWQNKLSTPEAEGKRSYRPRDNDNWLINCAVSSKTALTIFPKFFLQLLYNLVGVRKFFLCSSCNHSQHLFRWTQETFRTIQQGHPTPWCSIWQNSLQVSRTVASQKSKSSYIFIVAWILKSLRQHLGVCDARHVRTPGDLVVVEGSAWPGTLGWTPRRIIDVYKNIYKTSMHWIRRPECTVPK